MVASLVLEKLRSNGFNASITSGQFNTIHRINCVDRFNESESQVLVATDIVSRGIDCQNLKCVINFDIRLNAEGYADYKVYAYRVGRSGRFGQRGTVLNLIDSAQQLQILRSIADHFGFELNEN